jgi:hypothetical protein
MFLFIIMPQATKVYNKIYKAIFFYKQRVIPGKRGMLDAVG